MTSFCQAAWQHTEELQRAIAEHPFNRALAAGTLSRQQFVFYLVQDSRYLVAFSRALALASTRAPSADAAAFLVGGAHNALSVERTLHADYLDAVGAPADGIGAAPSCLAYASYLEATAANRPYPVVVAALLPCYWIYQRVGTTISEECRGQAGHPYRAWIDTYADEDFARSVEAMITLVDEAAMATDAEVRSEMLAAFTKASEYEWLFWESAWRLEEWPTTRWLGRA